MKLNDIIAIADKAYPDGFVGQCWDAKRQRVKPAKGDTLARFIVIELMDTHDPKATDAEQVETAANAMRMAARELETVACALEAPKA